MKKGIAHNPIHIYWLSGSGNSLLVEIEAESCLRRLGCNVLLLPMEKSDPAKIDTSAIIGFVVPVAGQGTFPLVWDFIRELPLANETPVFFSSGF